MVCLARRDHGSFPRALWLDGALGAAGAATALAAALSPVLSGSKGSLDAVIVGALYTSADLVLVAMICGLLAIRGTRGGSMWLWLAGGLATFCAADVVYALRVSAGTYEVGITLNALWSIGVTCMAIAIWRPHRRGEVGPGRSKAILAIPMVATLAAVVVLVISSFSQLPAAVVALATFTVLLAAARTFVSFQQVRRLSDARRQAITDELTALGNRRALFEHGALRLEAAASADRLAVILIDPKRARGVLEALRALGLPIAVDDYGTGYCALAYLRDLPVDELKIDRSFIAHVTTDQRSAAIVRSTIELAHALGLKVVAEGIEDQQAPRRRRGVRLRLRAGVPLQPAAAR